MNTNNEIAELEMFLRDLMIAIENELAGPNGESIMAGIHIFLVLLAVLAVLAVAVVVINLVCRWRIFTKAGHKGWKALIPIYNTYTEFTFTWRGVYGIAMMAAMLLSNILFVLPDSGALIATIGNLASMAAGILSLIKLYKLSRSFGHGIGYTLGLIFLNPVFMLLLAFGKKSQYVGPIVKK